MKLRSALPMRIAKYGSILMALAVLSGAVGVLGCVTVLPSMILLLDRPICKTTLDMRQIPFPKNDKEGPIRE